MPKPYNQSSKKVMLRIPLGEDLRGVYDKGMQCLPGNFICFRRIRSLFISFLTEERQSLRDTVLTRITPKHSCDG